MLLLLSLSHCVVQPFAFSRWFKKLQIKEFQVIQHQLIQLTLFNDIDARKIRFNFSHVNRTGIYTHATALNSKYRYMHCRIYVCKKRIKRNAFLLWCQLECRRQVYESQNPVAKYYRGAKSWRIPLFGSEEPSEILRSFQHQLIESKSTLMAARHFRCHVF